MRTSEFPIYLRRAGGAGFSVDFTLGSNGDPLSGYPGPWFNTANQALGDNVGTFTRGMQSSSGSFVTTRRDSTLFNGTFRGRIHNQAAGNDYSNITCRQTSAGNGGVILVAHSGTVTWKIQIYDPSNTLQLDYDTTVAFTPGNTYDLKLILLNGSVTGFIGGVQVGVTQTDSWSANSQTYMGYGINAGANLTTVESLSAVP